MERRVKRETYVWRNGKCVPKSEAGQHETIQSVYVQSDYLPGGAMRHPITGELMDSKSQFRAVTRAHGCVEVGNEVQRDTRRLESFDSNSRKADIARAIEQLGG